MLKFGVVVLLTCLRYLLQGSHTCASSDFRRFTVHVYVIFDVVVLTFNKIHKLITHILR